MHSEGTAVGLSVSVLKLAFGKFICPTNHTAYVTHDEGVKFGWIFSKFALLLSWSPSSIVRVLRESAIFPSADKCMHILGRMH